MSDPACCCCLPACLASKKAVLVQKVEDPVELWSIVSRACSKRYLLMMAKLWHRASVPEDRVAMDSFVLHAPQDMPDQAIPAADDVLAGQPIQSVLALALSLYPDLHLTVS